jgi:hypothetical protein
MWIVTLLYWLQAFASPLLLSILLAIIINPRLLFVKLIIAIGAIAGICLAEYIRRKIGLSTFFSRIYGSNEMDEKWKRKK